MCGRTWKKLDDLRAHLEPDRPFLFRQVDVRSVRSVWAFLDDVQDKLGPVDVLVNNAGFVHEPMNVRELDLEDLKECFETNVYGPFYAIHYLLADMIVRYRETSERSVIVNVASKAARWPTPRMSAYSASKAALVALTQALAKELQEAQAGIRAISISPGGMNT